MARDVSAHGSSETEDADEALVDLAQEAPADAVSLSTDEQLAHRIRKRLGFLGLTPRAASLRAGLSADAIRTILAGRSRSPRGETLAALAKVLQVDVGYLIGEIDQPVADPSRFRPEGGWVAAMKLPVRHEVAAGVWRAVDDYAEPLMSGVASIPVGLVPITEQWLEKVVGASMNRLIPDGAYVHVLDAIAIGYLAIPGDVVVVERTRAQGAFRERTLKQIAISDAGELTLWGRSFDDNYNVPLALTAGVADEELDETTVTIVAKVHRAYVDEESWRRA